MPFLQSVCRPLRYICRTFTPGRNFDISRSSHRSAGAKLRGSEPTLTFWRWKLPLPLTYSKKWVFNLFLRVFYGFFRIVFFSQIYFLTLFLTGVMFAAIERLI